MGPLEKIAEAIGRQKRRHRVRQVTVEPVEVVSDTENTEQSDGRLVQTEETNINGHLQSEHKASKIEEIVDKETIDKPEVQEEDQKYEEKEEVISDKKSTGYSSTTYDSSGASYQSSDGDCIDCSSYSCCDSYH